MSLTAARRPNLLTQLQDEEKALNAEMEAVSKSKKRAVKEA